MELIGLLGLPLVLLGALSASTFVFRFKQVSPHEISLHLLTGLVLVTYGFLYLRLLRAPPYLIFAPIMAGWAYLAFTRTRILTLNAVPSQPYSLSVVAPILLLGLYLATVIVSGIYMGTGDFPRVFINVDSAYYLQQMHSLAQQYDYPPPSLEVYGYAKKYHYGTQMLALGLSETLRITRHAALFLATIPALTAIMILVAYGIFREFSLQRRNLAIWACAALIFASHQYRFDYTSLSHIGKMVNLNEHYLAEYPFASSLMGITLFFGTLFTCMKDDTRYRALGAFLAGSMPLFKIPYLPYLLTGLGMIYAYEIARTRRLRLAAYPVAAVLLALLNMAVFAGLHGDKTEIIWGMFAGLTRIDRHHAFSVLLMSVVFLASGLVTKRMSWRPGLVRLLLMAVSFPILTLPIHFHTKDGWQLFTPLVSTVAIFVIAFLLVNVDRLSQWGRVRVVAMTAALFILPSISTVLYAGKVLLQPQLAHEFCDNRALADVLRHVPVEGSIVATNDLRYPAENFKRDQRQLQFGALFGHQNLVTDLVYENPPPRLRNFLERFHRLFATRSWDAAKINEYRSRIPVTHLVIHRGYPHPANIPIPMVYQNDEYQLYRF